MKRLTLVRHAHATWKEWKSADFDRPLTRQGNTEAEALGQKLLAQQIIPDRLVTSPAQRTQQTAEILAHELALPAQALQLEEKIYMARPQDLLRIIQATDATVGHLMLVGHNPAISEVAKLLAPHAPIAPFDTAAACTLTFEQNSWADVDFGKAKDARL